MNTLELRNIVLSQISQIEDKSLLAALKTILDTRANPQITLTNEQKAEIITSKKEIAINGVKDNVVLDKEMRQWLEEK